MRMERSERRPISYLLQKNCHIGLHVPASRKSRPEKIDKETNMQLPYRRTPVSHYVLNSNLLCGQTEWTDARDTNPTPSIEGQTPHRKVKPRFAWVRPLRLCICLSYTPFMWLHQCTRRFRPDLAMKTRSPQTFKNDLIVQDTIQDCVAMDCREISLTDCCLLEEVAYEAAQ